jgi:hypothetical protein
MLSMLLSLVCAGLLAFAPGAWAGERLIYAVVYKGAGYTAVKTEMFSIDPETAEKRLLFSDEKTSIVLLQRLYVFHFPVVGGRKLFAHAAERGSPVPFPGNGSLYELSGDGSNSFRRITHVLGAESLGDIFVNSTGTRIGYINRMHGRQYIFVHDVATGRLLHQVDITDKFLDCFASSIGWLPGTARLYFSLETGDEHVTSEESYRRAGTYTMDESGAGWSKLAALPPREGFFPPDEVRVIGISPSGEYVFETMQRKKGPSPGQNQYVPAVLKLKNDVSGFEDISFGTATKLYSGIRVNYQLSPAGRYLAAARLPISSSAVSCDICLKNLPTGEERKILSLPTHGLQGPFLGLVGWLDQ